MILLGLLVMAGGTAISRSDQHSAKATAGSARMEALWSDFEKDEATATRAVLTMSTQPAEAVAFLKDKLKPLVLDTVKLKAYLLRLGSANEALWKKAFEDLEYYDPRLAMDLASLMEKVTETPVRQRLVEVMSCRDPGSLKEAEVELRKIGDFYNFSADRAGWWAEHKVSRINSNAWEVPKRKWTRAVRAMMLLEHIGTPEALAILKDMAKGHPEAQPTRVARGSLERLAARRPRDSFDKSMVAPAPRTVRE